MPFQRHASARAFAGARPSRLLQNEDFRAELSASGFYQEWQKRYGSEAWSLLEATTGKLA